MPFNRIRRREFVTLLGSAVAWPLAARAQEPSKIYRIAMFGAGSGLSPKHWSILADGLRELGWIDGRNVRFEQRYAENETDRLPEFARELSGPGGARRDGGCAVARYLGAMKGKTM